MGEGWMLSTLIPGPRPSTAARTALVSSAAAAVMANTPASSAGRIFLNIGYGSMGYRGSSRPFLERAARDRFPRLWHGRLSAGVMLGVKALEPLFRHQGVNLRGAERA